jgi:hypothetical protein
MADPRKTVSFSRIGARDVSYKIDASTITYDATQPNGSAQVGLAVTLSADDTVALTADADFVLGKLLKVEADGYCTVQESGHMELPAGASASITRGKTIVGALQSGSAKGYIREVATGTAAELGKARGFIHNNATSTAVKVYLP